MESGGLRGREGLGSGFPMAFCTVQCRLCELYEVNDSSSIFGLCEVLSFRMFVRALCAHRNKLASSSGPDALLHLDHPKNSDTLIGVGT